MFYSAGDSLILSQRKEVNNNEDKIESRLHTFQNGDEAHTKSTVTLYGIVQLRKHLSVRRLQESLAGFHRIRKYMGLGTSVSRPTNQPR